MRTSWYSAWTPGGRRAACFAITKTSRSRSNTLAFRRRAADTLTHRQWWFVANDRRPEGSVRMTLFEVRKTPHTIIYARGIVDWRPRPPDAGSAGPGPAKPDEVPFSERRSGKRSPA